MMITWLIIFGIIYLASLVYLSYRSRKQNDTADGFMLAGGKIGMLLGFMSVAATLFSTFTFQGMPDFFRNHGIGSWIFLAIADGAMIFVIVWFGFLVRKKVKEKGFKGMAGLLNQCYGSRWAGILYFIGIFIFLVPYVAIQIRGISIFLDAVFEGALPSWAWATIIVGIMLLYSETGGLKAIMYADVMQGILLLAIIWIIAATCVNSMGGIDSMFTQVGNKNEALLSVPGPKGLFTPQFLLISFLGIVFLPITQPQISTRIVIMENLRSTHRMAVAVGVFAFFVILPTIAIGMYGAINYPDMTPSEFFSQVLLFDQHGLVAAASVIGLLAAAISTSDSQIFALGSEFRSLLKGEEKQVLGRTKIAIVVFALGCLLFSIFSSDQLVMLALLSFKGTALFGPLILAAILKDSPPPKLNLLYPAVGLVLSLLSQPQIKVLPGAVMGMRMDLLILVSVGVLTLVTTLASPDKDQATTS